MSDAEGSLLRACAASPALATDRQATSSPATIASGRAPNRTLDLDDLERPEYRDVDLRVDWAVAKPRMRRYHGYPYTSLGVKLVKL